MADFDWKQNDDKSGINLLPDDLRSKEAKELASAPDQHIELREPKKVDMSVPEGKVPWFSFRSWFSRDAKSKKDETKPEAVKEKKSKFSFRLIPSKKRKEMEELERAKEEALRNHIIQEVFQKKGLPLPENDNSLFNQERRAKQQELERHIGDMDIDSSGARPTGTTLTSESAVINVPKPETPISTDLPTVPAEKPAVEPHVAPVVAPEEPITPPLPPTPEKTPEQPINLETIATSLPPVTESVMSAPETPDAVPTKGFHMPTSVFHGSDKTKEHPKTSFGVNLIPTSITVKSWAQVRTVIFTTIVVTLILAAAAYGGLLWWDREIERQTAEVDAKIQAAEVEILKFQSLKDQITATENQIKDITQLLGKHIYWTQFFALLEKYTINDVYFERFAAGVNGNLSLNAHGKDYMTAARQLRLLQSPEAKEFVTSADINGVQEDMKGVIFTIDLQLNNKLFNYSNASSTQQ